MSNALPTGESPEAPEPLVTPEAREPSSGARGKLRALALKGSFFEILSIGSSQVLRFAGNLVLTRILFPEAFGLAALIAIFNQGLIMLSDVGITPGVVQSSRGDDVRFLNTAWTMHVVRGVVLFGLAVLLAWPVAWLYGEPLLGPLLAVGSVNVLISGFESTSMMTLLRQVDGRRKMIVEVTSQGVGLAITLLAAWMMRSVWALVIGGVVGSLVRTGISHFVDVGYKNRFEWSPEAARAIVRFGKWILFSSAVAFVAQQIDRVMLGKFLGFAELGVYTVAVTLAEVGTLVGTRLTHQVLFPVFSRVYREQKERLKEIYYRSRLGMDALILPASGVLCVLAPQLIDFLYDDRYEAAGWMLQVLVLRTATACVVTPCETCMFSMGQSHLGFVKSLARALWMIASLPVGYHLYGIHGLVWATALSEVPGFLILLVLFKKQGLLSVSRELLVPLLFAAGVAAGFLLSFVLPG